VLTVHAVLPADVDDPALASGGNRYDQAMLRGLARTAWDVRPVRAAGGWPRPTAPEIAALTGALAALPDGALVLADGLVVCAAPAAVLPAAARLRLVVLVHMPLADDPALSPADADALDRGERAVLRSAAAVVATSASAAQRLTDRHDLDPVRVRVVPPGVDPAPVAPGTDGVSALLCVAALTRGKGQDVLVKALAGVADLPWSCTLAGPVRREPATARRIRNLIAERGLDERIRLVGPQADMAPWYAAADLLVHPSRTETYGMVVTEALARAIPVLTTTAGALPSTLTGAGRPTPGLLVPPDDPSALTTALRRWLTDPALRTGLRAAAHRRRPTLISWPTQVTALATVLAATPEPAR
jgi:glycosyltransferase involved in cell wall biosynthesis